MLSTPLAVVDCIQLVHVSLAERLLGSLVLRPSYADDLGLGLKHRLDLAVELVGRHTLVLGLLDEAAPLNDEVLA